MSRLRITAAAVPFVLAAAIAGCGSSGSSGSSGATSKSSSSGASSSTASPAPSSAGGSYSYAPPAAPAKTTSAAAGLTIATRRSPIGTILVAANGRTVYLFEKDTAGRSSCAGACASAWPPVAAPATAGAGVSGAKLTTTTRSDGTKQAVYAGHPLYYFVSDAKAGDMKGQNAHAFGADWYAIGPAGKKVEKAGG